MGARRTVVLVRHGETLWNREGRYQGQTDVPLSDVGRAQARALRERLAAHAHLFCPRTTEVIASDLARAWETAEIAFGVAGRVVHRDPELRECRYGIFEGRTREEIEARWPDLFAEWCKGTAHVRTPGGETREEVRARTRAATLRHLARAREHAYLVAVVHGGVMRQLAPEAEGYENVAAFALEVDGDELRYAGRL